MSDTENENYADLGYAKLFVEITEEDDMTEPMDRETVVQAIDELGFDHLRDLLPVPNRFQDVRQVTNLVRFAEYAVSNLASVITEDIAEGQASAAILMNATQNLARTQEMLAQIAGVNVKGKGS